MKPGSKVGPYEIVGSLGAGGMGEVYRGRDDRLDRDVALKVLPDALAGEADRLARFEREAKTLAALNHPNIAQVYGLEQADSAVIVMELVEGEDLAERLADGPLPLEEALPIARQVAEALEAAHEAGIVHRDLKPANVKVRPDGAVKVLDFGLAKSASDPTTSGKGETRIANSPTLVSPAVTGANVILGTAAYMAPEQARGRPVDRRADVWAFGALLFEMLSGQRAFAGDDVSVTLASVIKGDVDWEALPDSVPSPVRAMIERCFQTEPRERYQSIGDARWQIERWLADGIREPAHSGVSGSDSDRGRRIGLAAIVGVFLVAVAIAMTWMLTRPADAPLRFVRLVVPMVQNELARPATQLSPDGESYLFHREDGLWLQRFDESAPRKLVEPPLGRATWSPTGDEVAYDTGTELFILTLASGSVRSVGETIRFFSYGLHWGASGRLLLSKGGDHGLRQVDIESGEASQLLELEEGDTRFLTPWELPTGAVMFSMQSRGLIEVFDGDRRQVVHRVPDAIIQSAVYAPTGHVVFAQWGANAGVWAAPFSLETLSLTSEPILLTSKPGYVSLSDDGLMVVHPTDSPGEISSSLELFDAEGEVVRRLLDPLPDLRRPAISPDGDRVAVQEVRGGGDARVVVHDLVRGTSVELGSGETLGNMTYPSWTPDGSRVVYTAGPMADRALFIQDAAGRTDPEQLVSNGVANRALHVTPDGETVVYVGIDGDLWMLPVSGGDPVRFRQTRGEETSPRISPDGRTIAYVEIDSEAAGSGIGLYVDRFPEGGSPTPVITAPNDYTPRWSSDGRTLYLAFQQTISAVRFDPERGVPVSRPEALFDIDLTGLTSYDVTADGLFAIPRSVVPELAPDERVPILIENWTKLLER